jgi:DNA-binding IclR family transcriptional regulator
MPTRPSPQTTRVVRLIEMLSTDAGGGLSLAEVSRRLGVHKASCHSMLSELLHAGWLVRDPATKTYRLGPGLIRLGLAASDRFSALDLVRPVMVELSQETGAHCIAFAISADHVTVVEQVRTQRGSGHPMAPGTELPTRPPYGASLAAWMPPEEREHWLAGIPESVRDHYRSALLAAQTRGFAIGLQVVPDVRLQELASLIRATEAGRGRLGELASALTSELILDEGWFPATLSARRTYDVSHIDCPVLGEDGTTALMLSLVPVPSTLNGSEVMRMGKLLATRIAQSTPDRRAGPPAVSRPAAGQLA